MIVRIHTTLENLSILGSVKEARRDPQRGMRSPLAQASRMLLHFDIAAVPSKLCGDRSLRDELQICELPFVDFIAPRSRELLASRREVLQTLTSCRYSPSLAADIAAVSSSCVVSDLYGNSLRPASLLQSISSPA